MRLDQYGQPIYTEQDLCDMYMRDPLRLVTGALVEKPVKFNDTLELTDIPQLKEYQPSNLSVEEWDAKNIQNWWMPDTYKNLDIAKWLLDQCNTEAELQRVGEELLLYQDRELFPLLGYLKYLVDTMKANRIVWGVGRGSSVASYVLYLIGVHNINSMFWDIPITEFLKD